LFFVVFLPVLELAPSYQAQVNYLQIVGKDPVKKTGLPDCAALFDGY